MLAYSLGKSLVMKEKAIELVNRFKPHVRWKMGQEDVQERAKECALICCSQERLAVENALESCGIAIELTKWNKYYSELEKEINTEEFTGDKLKPK